MYAAHVQENNNITGSCQGCESDARHSTNDANDAHAAFGMTRVIASSRGVPNCQKWRGAGGFEIVVVVSIFGFFNGFGRWGACFGGHMLQMRELCEDV